MVQHLIQHGIVENKSYLLDKPIISERLCSHWIRGYFDGDGSISLCQDGYVRGEFFGTYNVIKFIVSNIPSTKTVSNKKNTKHYYHSFFVSKKNNYIYNYLYKNSKTHLERKRIIFLSYKRKEATA